MPPVDPVGGDTGSTTVNNSPFNVLPQSDRTLRMRHVSYDQYIADFGPVTIPYAIALDMTNAEILRENRESRGSLARLPEVDKLNVNAEKIKQSVLYPAQPDNNFDELHDIRFSQFPSCNAQDLWVKASYMDKFRKDNLRPHNLFDISTAGLHSCITPKGYIECFNPHSTTITLKFFSRVNYKNLETGKQDCEFKKDPTTGASNFEFKSELKEVTSMVELHRAFFTLKTLRGRILPWDKSLEPIEYFLILENYFADKVLSGRIRGVAQSVYCANFIDHCLRKNGELFTKHVRFMDASDIQLAFKDFSVDFGAFVSTLDVHNDRQLVQQRIVRGSRASFRNSQPGSYIPYKPSQGYICRKFNEGACTNPVDRYLFLYDINFSTIHFIFLMCLSVYVLIVHMFLFIASMYYSMGRYCYMRAFLGDMSHLPNRVSTFLLLAYFAPTAIYSILICLPIYNLLVR